MIRLKCETCDWWHPQLKEPIEGECRRLPVVMLENASTGALYHGWPIASFKDWCGEHSGYAKRAQAKSKKDSNHEILK